MAIRKLPALVVNQIAAGEVVERPASVVKELVENAIDAGATRIAVTIEHGGRDLIRVTDNGRGIAFGDLPLAVAAHATSKIESSADLEAVTTLGFRGEALASIASISRMSLVSRAAGTDEAGRLDIEGQHRGEPRPASGPPGTTVTVRDLFFNTPARRKFIRADATETARVTQAVEALALAHAQVGVSLACDGRVALELPPDAGTHRRVLDVLGAELEPELLAFSLSERGLVISGMAGRPGIARTTARHQTVLVNGRPVSDRSITHAIREAYRGLIEPGRYPTIVLFLEIDPQQVDVNVHPTKAEVRFRTPSMVHGAVLSAIRRRLREADLTPSFELQRATASPGGGPASGGGPAFGSGSWSWSGPGRSITEFLAVGEERRGESSMEIEVLPVIKHVGEVLQVHSSYLVTQDEQGLIIVDQHALHERVMFETLLEAVSKGNLESQRLLMPAIVEVDAARLDLLEPLGPLFVRIGIEAEPAGPAAIAIHAFSSFLFDRGVEPSEFLLELLDRTAREGVNDDPEAALHETLDMMSCKAAIKAGDRLSDREIAELLAQRERVERSSNCPHGRPTTLRLTIRDLEKQFGRR
ncbi:MAG: DNA mismatch repair endonuclease MutL [Planctomycetes bacterium]|nr:DNA mismatch repair endonuclease MutL [Planctomycetota bacterium]